MHRKKANGELFLAYWESTHRFGDPMASFFPLTHAPFRDVALKKQEHFDRWFHVVGAEIRNYYSVHEVNKRAFLKQWLWSLFFFFLFSF